MVLVTSLTQIATLSTRLLYIITASFYNFYDLKYYRILEPQTDVISTFQNSSTEVIRHGTMIINTNERVSWKSAYPVLVARYDLNLDTGTI